ncbi:MAG: hypothetical protein ABI333_10310 [bacterium]
MIVRCRGLAALLAVAMLAGCGDGVPSHERDCGDGLDNDLDGRIDCEDSDCLGTVECPDSECGDGYADWDEECDGADVAGWTCVDLGYDGGELGCLASCYFDESQCLGDSCGNSQVDAGEECDGDNLDGESCQTQRFASGTLACGGDCLFNFTGCADPLLAECSVAGPMTDGVDGELTCASEGGVMEWDWWHVDVQGGDCVDVVVDNGVGGADLVAIVIDADGVSGFGWAEDFSQLDDEYPCSIPTWSGYDCPARSLVAEQSGEFQIFVAQWYDDLGVEPGVDTCSSGLSRYTLYVAVNGQDASPVLDQDDAPL